MIVGMQHSPRWGKFPKWDGEWSFRTRRFRFSCSVSDYSGKTGPDTVVLLKNRRLIEIYQDLLLQQPMKAIFEIGFFQGGMPLFFADMAAPNKFVGIDWNPPSSELQALIDRNDLSSSIELLGKVDQDDTARIRSILDERFGSQPLDLIIDDCSHRYGWTKLCFEALFGYLRPGGKYVIEDWGWTHWPSAKWQSDHSQFHGMESMTNLIFELIMALASNVEVISGVNVAYSACVIVTRGDKLAYKAPIDLKAMTHIAGGRRAELIVTPRP